MKLSKHVRTVWIPIDELQQRSKKTGKIITLHAMGEARVYTLKPWDKETWVEFKAVKVSKPGLSKRRKKK